MTITVPTILIDPLSTQSLLVETMANGYSLMTATAFVVDRNGRFFLITNWHVAAGRDPLTNQPTHPSAAIPDSLRIIHHAKGNLGSWHVITEPLYKEDGTPRWIEHSQGQLVDVVALPLSNLSDEIDIYPFNLSLADADLVPQPAMSVSIVGFPFGLSAGGVWPIWKTGHIATDPDIDFDGRPSFLIDATTRSGMSGSPVVVRSSGGHKTRSGVYILAGGITTKFLGVYSGRIRDDAELGRVWRPRVVDEILSAA